MYFSSSLIAHAVFNSLSSVIGGVGTAAYIGERLSEYGPLEECVGMAAIISLSHMSPPTLFMSAAKAGAIGYLAGFTSARNEEVVKKIATFAVSTISAFVVNEFLLNSH
ncbi:MAG: hypothetical protein KBC64_01370 [Simkaniaceae bacterium]|nr:hypothetical protein [Simkaniaceae bacterium]